MAIADLTPISDTPIDLLELRHRRRESALGQLVQACAHAGVLRHPGVVLTSLLRRERLGTTALGRGVAVPSLHSLLVRRPFVLLGRSARGLEWSAPDEDAVTLVAFVLTPAEFGAERHFQRVVAVTQALRLQRQRQRLIAAADRAAVVALLAEVLA